MEIPYVVNARKDTGLFNSKIAIWLFLASEVMLFGGLFSAYIFLRLGADYPWPERALPVLPGLINTFILILSSMTVVFAWAALKLRQWGKFQVNMAITLACAAVFMVLKTFEYQAKFAHQAVRMADFGVVEGHLDYKDHPNKLKIAAENLVVSVDSFHKPYLTQLIADADEAGFEFRLQPGTFANTSKDASEKDYNQAWFNNPDWKAPALFRTVSVKDGERKNEKLADAGAVLTVELLEQIKDAHVTSRTQRHKLNRKLRGAAWSDYNYKKKNGKQPSSVDRQTRDEYSKKVDELYAEYKNQNKESYYLNVGAQFAFTSFKKTGNEKAPCPIGTSPENAQFSGSKAVGAATTIQFKDNTTLVGKALDSSLHVFVDSIDFNHLVMRAIDAGKDPEVEIEKARILEDPAIRKVWEAKKKWLAFHAAALKEKGKVPTHNEKYRVSWQEMVGLYHMEIKKGAPGISESNWKEMKKEYWIDGFTGADHDNDHFKVAFPKVVIPRDQIRLESVFSPKWSNYYAIYFTMTGLHGLHVIGGALVLGYYLFFGRKMYESNPEWLANRVEVGGLFWHFVDLVWIFLFPIFYLM